MRGHARVIGLGALCAAAIAGCGESHTVDPDGGPGIDAQSIDGGGEADAQEDLDAPLPGEDAQPIDAGGEDAPPLDSGPPDAGADAPPPDPCTAPGTVETVACGDCGTTERFCTVDRVWAYGPCTGEGECTAGTIDARPCGRCGTRPARCTATCTWEVTGACTGEGECAPGTMTRSAAGCPAMQTREVLCSDACVYEPISMCTLDACPTPGATESVACGMCGTQQRFCDASRVWQYDPCGGEGVCAPGTSAPVACGMCGTRMARCTDSCTYDAGGTCTGEGECVPGTTMRTSVGCPGGQQRRVQCSSACAYETIEPCGTPVLVDVMLLVDITGSRGTMLTGARGPLQTDFVAPLLGSPDVAIGLSSYQDFGGDRPFIGNVEPTSTAATINAAISALAPTGGGDIDESAIEALSVLSGGAVHPTATALTCSGGRIAGGCWRPGARRVIVLFTDAANHNGPDPAGGPGLYAPYGPSITPAPAQWPAVRSQLMADGTLLLVLFQGTSAPARNQHARMISELGQPASDLIGADVLTTGLATAVARIQAFASM